MSTLTSRANIIFRKSIVPLLLLTICPPAVFVFWYTATALNGSFIALGQMISQSSLISTLSLIAKPVFFGSPLAWKILAVFAAFQLFLMKFVPGKPFLGPVTPKGNVPIYKANGIACYLITFVSFILASYKFHLFSPTIIYDNLGPLLGALNCFSLVFCLALYFKGKYAPSSSDSGTTGNALFDYYWGTELYPRIYGWDVKMFTNCRFGMMSWSLILLSYAAKQQQLYGLSDSMLVAVTLQLIYIAKFFFWETGYLRSLDIMHDRAGFMICWGCLVWVPCFYTLPTMYLVNQPIELGTFTATAIFLAGVASIAINFLADRQRQQVRAKNGACLIWGTKPILIHAPYQTQSGETKQTLLLASGWWGLSRHFHYIPEILAAFFWTVPALFGNVIPYFYVIFLTVLLIDRAYRHDKRCHDKYGENWAKYCEAVPYKIIPYLF
ncbi:MAG: 7-dehydrocholesterol reductase [Chlamydiae bacterium CG10_big_fil_rev_8_21_14_0_10_42_34]|nr:MAG: 7-dehydrocholesterol reductase [Chlamydiae bacterium CG10_big_fil_rev_8_21_14_0_10_42_34]